MMILKIILVPHHFPSNLPQIIFQEKIIDSKKKKKTTTKQRPQNLNIYNRNHFKNNLKMKQKNFLNHNYHKKPILKANKHNFYNLSNIYQKVMPIPKRNLKKIVENQIGIKAQTIREQV